MSGYLPESRGPSLPISGDLALYEQNLRTDQTSETGRTLPRFETSQHNVTMPVSWGSGSDVGRLDIPGAIDTLILDPDSLVWMKLKSLPKLYRIRQLEGQVNQLQKYLRECEKRN